ncbi:hypothetical protein ES319_D09G059000v1 [Gossypium barbadense]|uniref:Glycosyltransferase 61 catalytic domain-containing protein n=1 Tax=Gossypium barbadense TaxID=3634 RepID=A0A5J5PZP7_GOSBA|nr:hypothetical protein ES319_D09G059000v1 [Gossypium barbadense]PPD90202.1 hypothetical protein GOBAR_DD12865 [Gossypium barbadense]
MTYDTIFARSFSRYDQKKLGYGAFLGCLLIALSFCIVFKPYLGSLPVLNMRMPVDIGLKMLRITNSYSFEKLRGDDIRSSMATIVNETSSSEIEMVESDTTGTKETISNGNAIGSSTTTVINNKNITQKKEMKTLCHVEERTEFCEMYGDIRVDGKTSTVFMAADTMLESGPWVIRPYSRRGDDQAFKRVTKWFIKSVVDAYETPTQCDQRHNVPAIIFSTAGYAGNNFHDYTDIVLPLYLTSRQFEGEVKFLITDKKPWWIKKFRNILQKLSRYELVDIDKEVNVHCFTSVTVGLKRYPQELKIDSSKSPYSMKDFRKFLRSAYSLKKENAINMRDNGGKERPRLFILSRKNTRAFTNTNAIVGMATRLGFEVVVTEVDSHVAKVAEMVNSCDVMMGVHGAGLTNMIFLPENAILIQVIPIGGFEWLAKTDFAEPSKEMNLRYIGYQIKTEESTLIQQYPPDHEVLNDPYAIQRRGWHEFKSIYLQKQNVNLDVDRFRITLLRALDLLHQ